ncbi:MAG: PQQ-binding-like beta-propeller repeat protein [Planctomycetaceae bacterium]
MAQPPGPNRAATKFYPDFSDTADALLRNAASHARDGQWSEAVEIYQRVIEQFGDKVAKLPKDDPAGDPSGESVLHVDLRQFCQRRLAALPPEARAIYRTRADAQAERWYRQGASRRDRDSLRRVVEQAFCSSWGDDALDLLGDLAFQDGRFGEALSMYRQLIPDRPDDRSGLSHPDPGVDLARVAAKKLLCRAALGEDPPDDAALEAYERAYPNASGTLAGRTGTYLRSLAQALASDHLAPPAQPDGRWPTFAGAPTRTKVVPGSIDVGSLQWQVDLTPVTAARGSGMPRRMGGFPTSPVPPERLLAYHPIVLGDQVIVCDETEVVAYNLNDRPASPSTTINEVWRHEEDQDGTAPQATRVSSSVPRFTLTAFGDRIYARMGPTGAPYLGVGRMGVAAQGAIVALDRGAEGKSLWRRTAGEIALPKRPDGINRNTGFEGTPVADARGVYVAMTDRREMTSTYVVCLDAETGATRWIRYLGAAPSEGDNMLFGMGGMGMRGSAPTELGHRLLTLDGPTVYYQTNLGAVASLDAETGAIHWVATYPRQDRNEGQAHERDLSPAIVHDGLVIAAPDDAAPIFAFDAGSGRLVWKTDPLPSEVRLAHLLGVAKGRLIATGDRVLLFDVKTGKLVHTWPDSGRGYEGYGRGLLAGDRIYWPTRAEIHILDQASGLRTDPPIKLQETFLTTGGNLAVGDGYLIIAQHDKLVVFCQNSRLIQRYRDAIAHAPEQASNYYRLARAAEATGRDELALGSLELALRKARPSEMIDGLPLADAARDHEYRLLVKLGKQAVADKDWDQAARRFEAASALARSDRDRLAARLVLAEIQRDRGAPGRAVATLQRLLLDDRLRALSVDAADGHRTIRADLLIADRLAEIVRQHGRALYADFDREARGLLERGRAEKDPRLLEEVGRSYPVAQVVPEALLALGQLSEAARRPGEAAHAYKRLLAGAPNDTLRARALWGLAHAYEAQRLWVPARDTYVEALSRFADVRLEEFGTEARVADLVTERLAHEPFDRMMGDRSEPSVPVPLVRRWGRPLQGIVHPLGAEGVPPSAEASRIFLVQGTSIRPVDPATGTPPWAVDLGGMPVWVGYLADKLIAATETRLVALSLDQGSIQWQHELGPSDPARRGADPFAKAEPGPSNANARGGARAEGAPGGFQGFRIVGNRVFCLRGERDAARKFVGRELLALDGDTGLADWSYAPASGAINPNLRIGPQRIVLQVRKPTAVLVLETSTGRRRAEYPQQREEDWARPPLPIDDDHVALVADRQTVALFDLRLGVESWIFRASRELPKNGPPRLLGDAERLLVLHDGTELIRLDAATGKQRWSHPLGIEDLSERPEAMALDGERFYWASGSSLNAVALADGAPAWGRHLTGPEAGWSIALTERCVMAFPAPKPGQVEGEIDGLPLVFRRRDTGELVQRLLFPVAVTGAAVRLAPRGALVAAQGGVWSLGERREMDEMKPHH